MYKVFRYLFILAICLGFGVSVGFMLQAPQTPQFGMEGKVLLIDIELTREVDNPILRIMLKNNFTDHILNGYLTVYHDRKEWKSEVDWLSDCCHGYGFVKIECDHIVENQSFRLIFREIYSAVPYLDRIIEWDEVRTSD